MTPRGKAPAVAGSPVTLADCEAKIEQLNARIRSHGGRIELAEYDQPSSRLRIRLTGLCTACPAWPATLYGLVRPYLRTELGLEDVAFEDRRLSESAERRLQVALGGGR